jgi:2'-hydroxyisoflavone reductase
VISRRGFLKASAAAGGAVGLGSLPKLSFAMPRVERARAPLNILSLGGTGFTGPEQVEYAIARGHQVTLLNRNRTRPDFFKGRVDQLIGDLSADVSALTGKTWDVVIDNPTTAPAWVRNAAQYLKGNTKHHIFVSTVSAYKTDKTPNADESDPTTPLPAGLDPYTLDRQNFGKYYGALKTFSEQEVERKYPGMNTIIRPGLIVGPLDPSDRFTYWPYRIAKGGEILAPGNGLDPVQIVDARDIAEWTIRMAERRTLGTYNAVGPIIPMTFAEMLHGIKAIVSNDAHFTWVPDAFLKDEKVAPWTTMPVWTPDSTGDVGSSRRNISRALAAGLTFRPLAVTAKDTLDWNATRPAAQLQILAEGKRFGISPTRETEVLAAWKAKGSGKPA